MVTENLKSIGNNAFENCYGLCSFTIPESVETIGKDVFNNCIRLVELYNLSSLDLSKYEKKISRSITSDITRIIHTSKE